MIGQTLAHYRITALLGVGGMGEVYRATDTNLRREVAIKVLPPEVVTDPHRLGRFQREAHLLASLNHPNIAAIHGLEEAEGKPFLVLELVEGEDLRERLSRGAIPVEEALEIATQIAEALEEAHSKNIIHRDLKPANVHLTPEGKVKVLDFGLAKAWSGAGDSSSTEPSDAPTRPDLRTMAGVILGTAAYMSPEQARGKPVDKRSDVWSFGVLLGEMLTGRRLFPGDGAADVIASVVTKEPALEPLPASTPDGVRRLLDRCLRKDLRKRWPDIGAARLVLQDAIAGSNSAEGAPRPMDPQDQRPHGRRIRERLVWATVVVVLIGIVSLVLLQRPVKTAELRPVAHFVFDAPEGVMLNDVDPLAISPDGRSIVFAGRSPAGISKLWLRLLDAPDVRELPGTEGGGQPFWSPDGDSIGFFADGELKKVSLSSGNIQKLAGGTGYWSAGTWGSEGSIVFTLGEWSGLSAISAAGGEATALTTGEERLNYWWPQFLPDGRRLLFEIFGLQAGVHAQYAGVHVGSLDAPEDGRRLLPVPMRAKYGSGHLLFVHDGSTLMAQPFDLSRAELTGEPVAVLSSVASGMVPRWGWFSVSSTDVLTYLEGHTTDVQFVWIDRSGNRLESVGEPHTYRSIALSPEGRRIATVMISGTGLNDIWVIDVARGMSSRVTTGSESAGNPVWSPAGDEIIFVRGSGLYRQELRAGATASALGVRGSPEDWSSDGKTLLYRTTGEEDALWAMPLDGDGSAELVLKTTFSMGESQLSPDGRWFAYVSDESGRYEVYIEPFRHRGDRIRISPDGGRMPRWRGDGQELFYLSDDRRLMAVDLREGTNGIEVGMPRLTISSEKLAAVVGMPLDHEYAVSPDGQRFLLRARVDQDVRQRIHVVTNWSSLLE